MKKLIAVISTFLAACSSFAAPLVDTEDAYHEKRPSRIMHNGNIVLVGSDDWLVSNAGWTYATPERIAAEDSAKAAAQAEAEALRGPAPEVFVPMLNSDGEPVGTARLVVIEGSLAVVASTNSASPQKPWAEQKDQILAQLGSIAESKATAAAARLAIKQTVLAGDLAEEDLGLIVDLWPAWAAGVSYAVDEIVRHEGSLYKVVQAHTSQADWPPPDVPALFATITPPGLIAEWVQPTGAQDTYSLGDLVTHVGQVWESTVDNNSWEPGVYGWVEVE